jgi:hypothetical protein
MADWNYKVLLDAPQYDRLKQAAIDMMVRDMMNAGCAWAIIYAGLRDLPFQFDPNDADHVALLKAAAEKEQLTVPEMLGRAAENVLAWVTPGICSDAGSSPQSLVEEEARTA